MSPYVPSLMCSLPAHLPFHYDQLSRQRKSCVITSVEDNCDCSSTSTASLDDLLNYACTDNSFTYQEVDSAAFPMIKPQEEEPPVLQIRKRSPLNAPLQETSIRQLRRRRYRRNSLFMMKLGTIIEIDVDEAIPTQ